MMLCYFIIRFFFISFGLKEIQVESLDLGRNPFRRKVSVLIYLDTRLNPKA